MYLPDYVIYIINRLADAGYEAYVVGGAVRDMLCGDVPHDYDVATSALPDQTAGIFSGHTLILSGMKHGTVGVVCSGTTVEITTFRTEGTYSDHRRPDSVNFTKSLTEDLARRDFTVCAMAYSSERGLIDPYGGEHDLRCKILRAVGDPERRFCEDALRIMRGIRFISVSGLEPEADTGAAMKKMAPGLLKISAERIWAEFFRAVSGGSFSRAVMQFPSVICTVIPELSPSVGFDQNSIYHHLDVYSHIAAAIAAAEKWGYDDEAVRIALLMHDSGKPAACTEGDDGRRHFKGHGQISRSLCETALRRMRAPEDLIKKCGVLTEIHDLKIRPERKYMMNLLRRLGFEDACRIAMIRRCDLAAHAPGWCDGSDAVRCLEMAALLKDECYTRSRLAVTGNDIVDAGVTGKRVGEILDSLLDEVCNGVLENDRKSLIEEIEKMVLEKAH